MTSEKVLWTGNICAAVTPFNKDGGLDEKGFVENLSLLIEEGVDGFVILGDTGEFWSVGDDERNRLTELAMETAAGQVPVIVGCNAVNTQTALKFGKMAKEVGADGIMLTPPFYVCPNKEEIFEFFRTVGETIQLPMMLYNIPKRHNVALTLDIVDRLADFNWVSAFKQSDNGFTEVVDTIRLARGRFSVLAGHSVERGFPAVAMGADGYLSSVEPQVMGREAVDMYRLAKEGKFDDARRVQLRCVELDHAVHGAGITFPASLKAAMNLVGRPGGYPREPLKAVTEEQEGILRKVLESLSLL